MFKIVSIPLVLPKFSPYRNGEFSLYRKLYATEIKVDYSTMTYAYGPHLLAICCAVDLKSYVKTCTGQICLTFSGDALLGSSYGKRKKKKEIVYVLHGVHFSHGLKSYIEHCFWDGGNTLFIDYVEDNV